MDATARSPLATPTEQLMDAPVVGFAGMTHLGIVSGIAIAARGFSVVGYDRDESLTGRLDRQDLPIPEPDLDRFLAANRNRIRFSSAPSDVSRCDVVYIAADVPTDDAGDSDLIPIAALVDGVSRHLRDDAVLVVVCQVPPGFTRTISRVSHSRLFYQVETLIFGRAIERALNAERFIVGCADPGKPAAALILGNLNLAGERGTDIGVVNAWIANSCRRRDWCWRVLKERVVNLDPTARVGVLGLAYKEHTHSTKNSPALTLLGRLRGMDLRVHDPVVPAAIVPYSTGCFRAAGLRRGCGRARAHNAMAAISRTADRRSCTAHDRTGVDRSTPSIIRWLSRGSRVRMSRPRDAAARARRAWVTAMREHGNDRPDVPERVVVMGAGGFVGNAIACRLERDGVLTHASLAARSTSWRR